MKMLSTSTTLPQGRTTIINDNNSYKEGASRVFWQKTCFSGLDQQTQGAIAKLPYFFKHYKKGEFVFKSNDKIRYVTIVSKGILKSSSLGVDGKEYSESYFITGDILPLYLIYAHIESYLFDTYCLEDSELAFIELKRFMQTVNQSTGLMQALLTNMALHEYRAKIYLRAVHYRKISSRLAYWLLYCNDHKNEFELSFSQDLLASFLHVNRSNLNVALHSMVKNKAIVLQGRYIRLLDKGLLMRYL